MYNYISTFRKICLSENLTVGKCSCRIIWCRKICFGKFGVGKSVSENSVSENLLSEKSPDTVYIHVSQGSSGGIVMVTFDRDFLSCGGEASVATVVGGFLGRFCQVCFA